MKIAVLSGGISAEREVSIQSGKAVSQALHSLGHDVVEVDVDSNIVQILQSTNPDLAFIALHGKYGEDGCIAGLLEVLGIRYTHSGVMASAIAMNKVMTKHIMSTLGIKSPQSIVAIPEKAKLLPYPYVIKPINEGSSIGVHIISSDEDYQRLVNTTRFIEPVLVEEYIAGQEIQTAVLLDEAIGTIEIRSKNHFYDYQAKYSEGFAEHIFPASVPLNIYNATLEQAQKLHKFLGCRTLSRCDFIYSPEKNKLYMLEINTHPGFTPLSLVPEIALKSRNISFTMLLTAIIEDSVNQK